MIPVICGSLIFQILKLLYMQIMGFSTVDVAVGHLDQDQDEPPVFCLTGQLGHG